VSVWDIDLALVAPVTKEHPIGCEFSSFAKDSLPATPADSRNLGVS